MKIKKTFFVLTICSVLSVGFMIVLYLSSKQILRYHNNFIRIFPRVLAEKKDEFDLKFNSFYFAGISESEVFLGNTTTPLKITIIDSSLKKIKNATNHFRSIGSPISICASIYHFSKLFCV